LGFFFASLRREKGEEERGFRPVFEKRKKEGGKKRGSARLQVPYWSLMVFDRLKKKKSRGGKNPHIQIRKERSGMA